MATKLVKITSTALSFCATAAPHYALAQDVPADSFVENTAIVLLFIPLLILIGIVLYRTQNQKTPPLPLANKYLAALEQASQGFAPFMRPEQKHSTKEAMGWLLKETARTLDVSQVCYWSFEREQSSLMIKHFFDAHGDPLPTNQILSRQKHPNFFAALEAGRTICFSDAPNDPRCAKLMDPLPPQTLPKSIMAATVGIDKEAHGVLLISAKRKQRYWEESEQQYAGAIADLAAFYLTTQDLQTAQKAFEKSETRFRDLVDASSDWYWETDREHRFSYFSEQFTALTGIPQQTLLGKTRNIFAKESAMSPKWINHWDDLQNHRPFRDFKYSTPVGERILRVSINGKPHFDKEGKFLGYRGTGSDVTETAAFKTRFEEGINALPNGFLMWDADDHLVMWNKTILDIFPILEPYTKRPLSYLELVKLCGQEEAIKYPRPLDDSLCDDILKRHKAGGTTEVELTNGKYLLVNEQPTSEGGIIGIYTDITTLKEREKELIRNKRYSEAQTQCSNVLFHARNESFILSEVCRIITETDPFDVAWISLFNTPGQLPEFLKVNVQKGMADDLYEHRPSSTLKQVFIKQEHIEFSIKLMVQAYPDFKKHIEKADIKYAGIFPIWIDTKIAGFLNVATSQRSNFRQRHVSLLMRLANDIGYGLSSLRSEQSRLIAEEALRESEGRYRSLVEMSPDAILVLDENQKIVFSNPESYNLFATIKRNDIINQPFSSFTKSSSNLFKAPPAVDDKDPAQYLTSVKLLKLDGTEFEADITAQPVSYAGLTTRLLIIRDVTERNRMNEHLAQTSKLATLGEMAAGITHELSQPLNIMRFAAEGSLLKMDKNTLSEKDVQKQLNLISMQSARMADIIDHMRVFSRKDTGEIETFDPTLVVRQSVDMVEAQFFAEGIILEARYPSYYGKVKGRPIQLEQVILNLINNARDAINQRYEQLDNGKNEEKRIIVIMTYDQADDEINIAVTDNGGGIEDDVIAKLFDPFFTTKEVGKGTGLGLSVSYGIIAAMGGTIQARNIHKGARFDICLPCFDPQTETTTPAQPPLETEDEIEEDLGINFGEGEGNILVVDDEIYAAEAMMEYLLENGYFVNIASDGEEALNLFDQEPADVVVTDMRMPKMDGYILLKNLKKRNPDIPVIIVTGHTGIEESNMEELHTLAFNVLKKPVSLSQLSSEVEKALQTVQKYN
ncbi:PAS domain S-box protein [Terasakiella sp. SH-1]|uniref:PAS domain S-box protein n=1 Tax=Terasakiella sp. SH-1 TaxID=2560057 RepID=UPI0014311F02|nr:PAS domain S-box protein [Terasakiella sp. SH-1]